MGNEMQLSLPELAERLVEQVNSGEIDWGDILFGPRFAKGQLNEQFNERIANEGDEFFEGLIESDDRPLGWTDERLRLFAEGADAPTLRELEAWAEAHEIEPDWLLSASLSDESGPRGWAVFIQNVSYCDGGPLFEVLGTFVDEPTARAYVDEHYPTTAA
jgi:hypothetical protein